MSASPGLLGVFEDKICNLLSLVLKLMCAANSPHLSSPRPPKYLGCAIPLLHEILVLSHVVSDTMLRTSHCVGISPCDRIFHRVSKNAPTTPTPRNSKWSEREMSWTKMVHVQFV